MKLYTENQVKSMLGRARLHKQDDTEMFTDEYLISQETPIELPGDEEIEEAAIKIVNEHCDSQSGDLTVEVECFEAGVYWMKEQILNQKK